MSRPLVIAGCACSGLDAPIVRGSGGTLVCLECGADEAALIAYADALEMLPQLPLRDLVAEVDRRTTPDFGLSSQLCPRCSTPDTEVYGETSRKHQCFTCRSCRLILPLSTYEIELERFGRQRWRAIHDLRELRAL